MAPASKMNSEDLQKNFHSIYKDFFNRHDLVLSGNGVLTWGPDVSHGVSVIRIKQKLPLKTYCGVSFNASKKVTFRTVTHYSSLKDSFEKDDFESVFKKARTERVSKALETYLAQNGNPIGMDISLLTEAPKWHGFAFSSVVSVLFSHILAFACGKLDSKTFCEGMEIENSKTYAEVFHLSQYLLTNAFDGDSNGSANRTSMTSGISAPLVHIVEEYSGGEENEERPVFQDDSSKKFLLHQQDIYQFLWTGKSMSELPFHYGVLYSGVEYTFSELASTRELLKKDFASLDAFMAKSIASLPLQDTRKQRISNLLDFDKNQMFLEDVNVLNTRILKAFDGVLNSPYDEGEISDFIRTIQSIGLKSLSYQRDNKIYFALQHLFYKHREYDDEDMGIFPYNTWKNGWSIFFVLKNNKSRDTFLKVLDLLRVEWHSFSLDYASWRDGHSADGIKIEQYLSKKMFSEYTKEWNVAYSDNTGSAYLGDYDSVIEEERECILLDTIQGRIYIKGTKLTSKEIHSQNTTIDMMKILLENIGKEVSNSKLPVSTYSKNKNEILSKVILPIRKLSKEHFWKEIPLVCSGGITDYYLKLEKDDSIRIGIIKKIG